MNPGKTTIKDSILFGGKADKNDAEKCGSVGKFALQKFKEKGSKVLMIDGLTGEQLTGNELHDLVVQCALGLKKVGVKEADVVGICSENRMLMPVTVWAAICCNASVAPLNVTYTESELHHALNLSKPKIIFASSYFLEKLIAVAKKNSFVKKIIVYGDESPISGIMNYKEFVSSIPLSRNASLDVPRADDDLNVLIMCSSGTTGLAKGVQLTQKNIKKTIGGYLINTDIVDEVTLLTILPFFHAFGLLTLMFANCVGGKMVFLPKFEEHLYLKTIQDYKINVCFLVPPLMVFLAKNPLIDEYDISSLMAVYSGAAPLSKETENAVRERIGVMIVRQGYGLSETTLNVLVQNDDYYKPGSVGQLRQDTYAKVIDVETGKPLGPNERGELCFKGDIIMKGYIGDKASTKDMIDKDGWLHTGDVGYYDEDFEFFIVDRIKELIKYKAFQVPPAELEALLLTNPKIKDAGVVGVQDEESGELPFAFVVKQRGAEISEKEVIDFVADRVSSPKRLRGGVRFVNEIPRNLSGKILRRVLKEMLKEAPPMSKL